MVHLVRSGWEFFINRALLCSEVHKGSSGISVAIWQPFRHTAWQVSSGYVALCCNVFI